MNTIFIETMEYMMISSKLLHSSNLFSRNELAGNSRWAIRMCERNSSKAACNIVHRKWKLKMSRPRG